MDPGEACDDESNNSDTSAGRLPGPSCVKAACGGGGVDPGEVCDDGPNNAAGAACTPGVQAAGGRRGVRLRGRQRRLRREHAGGIAGGAAARRRPAAASPRRQLLFWQVSVVRSHEKLAFAPWMPSVVPTVTIASPPPAGTRNRTDLLTTSKSNDVDFV